MSNGSPPVFSKGHGAYSETGGLKSGKTEIRPSAVESVGSQWGSRVSGGTVRFGGGDVDLSLVPRTSAPSEFRVIGSKTGGGGSGGPTSFPVSVSSLPSSLSSKLPSGGRFSEEPQSPRPSRVSMPPVVEDSRRTTSTGGNKL